MKHTHKKKKTEKNNLKERNIHSKEKEYFEQAWWFSSLSLNHSQRSHAWILRRNGVFKQEMEGVLSIWFCEMLIRYLDTSLNIVTEGCLVMSVDILFSESKGQA